METSVRGLAGVGPRPTARQMRNHRREFYGFIHFTTNTFTDKEWGFGDEAPGVFAPTAFDADQIVDSFRLAGMKGVVLTCKHHDGFCLWPSQWTGHSVAASPFRGGKGDVVREIEQACRAVGMEVGVYLSPWDRHHAEYGRGAYIEYYRRQLRELLTGYGEIFSVWFDGANGGDGFYGGAREMRKIDNRTYYDWEKTWEMVRELQPEAVMFSDAGPDVRWVGNEDGIAGDPCWYTVDPEGVWPGHADNGRLNSGQREGSVWRMYECNTSIRPGWFYHTYEDERVRSAGNLVDLYFKSVGRGGTFMLNLPPDRRGLVHERDRESLAGFRAHLDRMFAVDVAAGGRVTRKVLAGGEGVMAVEVGWTGGRRFNVIELRERIEEGQRVGAWVAEADVGDGVWREIARAEAVGYRRLVRVPETMAVRVRVRVLDAMWGPPLVDHLGLYLEPEMKETGGIVVRGREVAGVVSGENEVVFDLEGPTRVKGIRYQPGEADRVDRYEVAFAMKKGEWGGEGVGGVVAGEFGNVVNNPQAQVVGFEREARYVRFRGVRFAMGGKLGAGDVVVMG